MANTLNIKTVNVCRTCTEEIINTSFFHLDFTRIDGEPTIGQKLSSCIPELDLNIVPNTVICGRCVDTINSLYIFKEECLQLEMQIREYIQQVQHPGSAIDLAAVMRFHQLVHPKIHTAELKTEAFEKTENCKNEESPSTFCDNYAFNKTEENTATGVFEKTENYKNEEPTILYDCYAFNETKRCIEIPNKEYLTSLEMVERESVVFNTVENFINSDQSEAEENSDTHNDSNIVIEHSFNQKNNLKTHLLTDAYEKLFKCSVCEYSCNRKKSLRSHLLNHIDEKPFKCSVCDYRCNRKESLRSHMLNHIGEKLFKCSVCEYSCNRKESLKRHMQTHTSKKPLKCSTCEYSCIRKEHLKRHMLTHTGEKPFKCSICEYSCSLKHSLKCHILTHTGEKPFKCSICEYSCNNNSNLKSHILRHAGEKPFKCSICEYRSARRNQLKIHMQNHL